MNMSISMKLYTLIDSTYNNDNIQKASYDVINKAYIIQFQASPKQSLLFGS